MDSLGARNLRSLHDTGLLKIRPCTLLLGANSSGKSTFLRLFPLLRQSVEVRTTGPLLWYGRYVDFGSFEEARTAGTDANCIELHAQLSNYPLYDRTYLRWLVQQRGYIPLGRRRRAARFAAAQPDTDVIVNIEIAGGTDGHGYVRRLHIQLEDHRIELEYSNELNVTIRVNETTSDDLELSFSTVRPGRLIPLVDEIEETHSTSEIDLLVSKGVHRRSSLLLKELVRAGNVFFHGNTLFETRATVLSSMPVSSSARMLRELEGSKEGGSVFKQRVANLDVSDPAFRRVADLRVMMSVPDLVDAIDTALAHSAEHTRYLAPLRAGAERYYRTQGLSIDEVDYEGRNLAMFIRGLSSRERSSLQAWLRQLLGVTLKVHTQTGQLQLAVREHGTESFNIADVGTGLSQVLPVVIQIWLAGHSDRRGSDGYETVAIEQPELHLHPTLQTSIADAVVKSLADARSNERRLRFVLETHSEAIVNRIGRLVAQAQIPPEDVGVYLFEKDEDGISQITTSEFSEDGVLKNWPYGFFQA